MIAQASFDELISYSLGCESCPNVKSSGSIDDFLADYRHERSSIQSFISSLEDDVKSRSFEHHDVTCPVGLSSRASKPLHSTSTLPVASIEEKKSNLSTDFKGKRIRETSNSQTVSARKAVRSRTDNESKEERRRSKNCEYQRRFREKKMRLEMQRQYMAACPPCAHFNFPHPCLLD